MIKLTKLIESFDIDESKASEKAKQMGLDYMEFGRWGKNGMVTHKSQGDTVVPVKTSKPAQRPNPAGNYDEPSSPDYLGYDEPSSPADQDVEFFDPLEDPFSDDAMDDIADTFMSRPTPEQIDQLVEPYHADPQQALEFFNDMKRHMINNIQSTPKSRNPHSDYARFVDAAKGIELAASKIRSRAGQNQVPRR